MFSFYFLRECTKSRVTIHRRRSGGRPLRPFLLPLHALFSSRMCMSVCCIETRRSFLDRRRKREAAHIKATGQKVTSIQK